jgi:glycosyltransferase involved in cell wall biosynthesis
MRPHLCIGIPTYTRPHLLALLLEDLARQTVTIDRVVVVDGKPSSSAVLPVLQKAASLRHWVIVYIPSNHANVPFQRYLAWHVAREDVLLYLDDDIRIPDPETVGRILEPFTWEDGAVAGVTGTISYGDPGRLASASAFREVTLSARQAPPRLVRWLGGGGVIPPGGVTRVGDRRPPLDGPVPGDGSAAYTDVEWMRGGCMAYRKRALTQDVFSEDLFSEYERRWGKGEDTYLSRQALRHGRLVLARHARVEHPDADLPVCYPTTAKALGFAIAYSRRLLNDTYQISRPATLDDRLALLQSYLGRSLLAWSRAVMAPAGHRWAYAWGFTLGAITGVCWPPVARRLTPGVNWEADAKRAVAQATVVDPILGPTRMMDAGECLV